MSLYCRHDCRYSYLPLLFAILGTPADIYLHFSLFNDDVINSEHVASSD
jgi:hypothetical protein